MLILQFAIVQLAFAFMPAQVKAIEAGKSLEQVSTVIANLDENC